MAVTQSERRSAVSGASATASVVRARLRDRLGIDVRAIAAFRIGLGLVVLADLLALRLPGLVTFYTDRGVLPRSALAEAAPTLATWSLHAQSGAVWVQAVLLAVTALVAVAVLLGYRSRTAAVSLALLLASMHARNPYLVNGGDTVLISLLVFGAALPLDARWALRRRGRRRTGRVCSAATGVLCVHVVGIYALNALLKVRSDAWMDGVAVQRIFQLEDFVYLLGPALSTSPVVLTAINWLWIATLTAAVGFILFADRLRLPIVAAFVGAHLGMAVTMRLGSFPFVMCVAVLPFLPPRVWNRVDRVVEDRDVTPRLRALARTWADASPSRPAEPLVPRSVRRGLGRAATVLLVCALIATMGWQVVAADVVDTPAAEGDGPLGDASWKFFAPEPPSSYSWYVVEAAPASGPAIDLVDGEPVTFDRPPNAMNRYPSTLWKRYGTKGQGSGEAVAAAAAGYACERAPDHVTSVTVYRVRQSVDANGPVGDPAPTELAARACE